VRAIGGLSVLIVLSVAASGCGTPASAPVPKSPTTTSAPTTTSTTSAPTTTSSTPTTTSLYSIEPCGGITTSSDLHPGVDNRSLLLTDTDGPTGYTYGVAKTASGPTITASVPSYSPAVYESFQVPAANGGSGGQEVIGVVGSADDATQLAQQVQSNLVSCNGGEQVPLPTSVPGISAETSTFALSRSNGWVSNAAVTMSKGPYIVSLQWSNSNSCSTYGGSSCPPAPTAPPPIPSASEMAQLVNAALAKIG
jgi:hypothetical protein